MNINVTVCELPNKIDAFEHSWNDLVDHLDRNNSDLLVLPEMPFYSWLCHSDSPSTSEWKTAVDTHLKWIRRFDVLNPAIIVGSRPDIQNEKRVNSGFCWMPQKGLVDIHNKYYLPDEPGFWEATWYGRGDGTFKSIDTDFGHIGFLICTEIWFTQHARQYGKKGVQLLVNPRVTPEGSAEKWLAGGQTAAVVSGAFCLSSNLSGAGENGQDYAGMGWIIDPEEGEVLGTTDDDRPFLTLQIDLDRANLAKETYPRYVRD